MNDKFVVSARYLHLGEAKQDAEFSGGGESGTIDDAKETGVSMIQITLGISF